MRSDAPPFSIRAATDDDRSLIIDSWLQSYKDSQFAKRLPLDVYWSRFGHVGVVESLYCDSEIAVACLPDDPTFVYGWCAWDSRGYHYVWVKGDYRRMGIGSALVRSAGVRGISVSMSHVTVEGQRLCAALCIDPKFANPYRESR